MLFALLSLLFVYGRIAQVNGDLEASTRDAARAASLARSESDANTRAVKLVREHFTAAVCPDDGIVVQGFAPGAPLSVTVTCTYPLSDLGLPGAPSHVTVTSRFDSYVDDYRTVRP